MPALRRGQPVAAAWLARGEREGLPEPGERRALAARVGPSGAVVALDPDHESIRYARRRYTDSNIAWEIGGIGSLEGELDGSFDVVIAPCYATAAFPHFSEPDPWPGLNRTLRIDGGGVPYAPQHAWALYAGMARLPVTAAPIGRTRGGLPIGAQFIGPYLEDLTTIAFAAHVSEEFGLTAEIAEAGG